MKERGQYKLSYTEILLIEHVYRKAKKKVS